VFPNFFDLLPKSHPTLGCYPPPQSRTNDDILSQKGPFISVARPLKENK